MIDELEKKEEILEVKSEMESNKLSTPNAIVLAGVLVMLGILLSGSFGGIKKDKDTSLSAQVGVNKEKFNKCVEEVDKDSFFGKINESADKAMSGLDQNERGTPYAVIVGKDGLKNEIRGAEPIENIKKLIDEVKNNSVVNAYSGDLPAITEDDHIYGNPNAPIFVIEYSDYSCPFCARLHVTMKSLVDESNGEIAWVYRHWPIKQDSFDKVIAAECVSQLKGNDAFWKYSELLFELITPKEETKSNNL